MCKNEKIICKPCINFFFFSLPWFINWTIYDHSYIKIQYIIWTSYILLWTIGQEYLDSVLPNNPSNWVPLSSTWPSITNCSLFSCRGSSKAWNYTNITFTIPFLTYKWWKDWIILKWTDFHILDFTESWLIHILSFELIYPFIRKICAYTWVSKKCWPFIYKH